MRQREIRTDTAYLIPNLIQRNMSSKSTFVPHAKYCMLGCPAPDRDQPSVTSLHFFCIAFLSPVCNFHAPLQNPRYSFSGVGIATIAFLAPDSVRVVPKLAGRSDAMAMDELRSLLLKPPPQIFIGSSSQSW